MSTPAASLFTSPPKMMGTAQEKEPTTIPFPRILPQPAREKEGEESF